MKLFYDLHIHSCLSPCGDDDMTPNNIVNMSLIKGLDLIAVTDHNHSGNCRAVMELAKETGLIVIPGMEVQTKEEVHILCYFMTLEDCEAFNKALEPYRLKIPNNVERFGQQSILDENDKLIENYPFALILGTTIGLEALEKLVLDFKGWIVPAHINKSANSILANLGFMPQNLKTKTIEVYERAPFNGMMFKAYRLIKNSDAHMLEQISEPEHAIEVVSKDLADIFNVLFGECL